jgi:hypothetical protein
LRLSVFYLQFLEVYLRFYGFYLRFLEVYLRKSHFYLRNTATPEEYHPGDIGISSNPLEIKVNNYSSKEFRSQRGSGRENNL